MSCWWASLLCTARTDLPCTRTSPASRSVTQGIYLKKQLIYCKGCFTRTPDRDWEPEGASKKSKNTRSAKTSTGNWCLRENGHPQYRWIFGSLTSTQSTLLARSTSMWRTRKIKGAPAPTMSTNQKYLQTSWSEDPSRSLFRGIQKMYTIQKVITVPTLIHQISKRMISI